MVRTFFTTNDADVMLPLWSGRSALKYRVSSHVIPLSKVASGGEDRGAGLKGLNVSLFYDRRLGLMRLLLALMKFVTPGDERWRSTAEETFRYPSR